MSAATATPANVFLGTGRRKTSTARVRITEGTGKLIVNGRDFEKYFSHENFAKQAYAPLLTVELREKIDVTANVAGGGVTGQAGAMQLALARAVLAYEPAQETVLREQSMLTRDARKVERKKYGQAGARRRFQFSKR